jgi:hypothetical protein
MPLLCKVLAFYPFDQEPHPNGPNVGFARRAGTPIIVGPAAQLPCFLHSWRSWTVHSEMCQRALGLQRNRTRLSARPHARAIKEQVDRLFVRRSTERRA